MIDDKDCAPIGGMNVREIKELRENLPQGYSGHHRHHTLLQVNDFTS
jgi:hypothetical protein